MKTLKASIVIPVVVMLVALFGFGTAFADANGAPPTPADAAAMMWLVVGTTAATVWGGLARYLTGRFNFFHNGAGMTIIAIIGAVINAVAPVVEHGWNKWAVFTAALGAITAFVGAANSGQAGQTAAAKATVNASITGPGPTITKAPAFIPIAFALGALLMGCAHVSPTTKAFDAAFGACMEQHGLLAAPGIGQQVWDDLNNGASKDTIVTQLEGLVGKVGEDAVTCAVTAWLTAPSATAAEKNPNGIRAANEYLAKHPARTKQ